MTQTILKLIALSLLVSTAFIILTGLGSAQGARDQTSSTATLYAPTEKTVEQVFKNVKVLNGMPQSQWYPVRWCCLIRATNRSFFKVAPSRV